ncbi:AsmA family protein [Pontibaca salina]|uniref:AsmA family protein n=1 Tax=Pontibaca salina TaxID=2795731 RepID=A0A934M131_9RHOB|nr:AsmA family protein [Pontibaca salina]MBI6629261.1 AsmA family protein [Pontibaca salina]
MRWLFRIVGALVVASLLLGAALIVLPIILPGERIAQIAVDQVRARTGRDLEFSGDVSFTYWPVLGVTTGPVILGNADWAGPEPLLRAQALTVGLAAPDLLRGKIRITEITAQSPDLHLATRAHGHGNWEFAPPASPATASGPEARADGHRAVLPILEKLNLTNARLTWSQAGADPRVLDGVDLALNWPEQEGAADLKATIRPAGTPVRLAAQIGRFASFLAGEATEITASVDAAEGQIIFDGRVKVTGEAAGRVTFDSNNTARMMAALGVAGAELPKGLGQVAHLSADMSFAPNGPIVLRDFAANLDGNRLSGAVNIALSSPPRITGQISAGVLDLRTETGSGSAIDAPKTEGWSDRPIDASALALVDGAIDLTVQGILLDTTEIGALRANLSLNKSRAVLDLSAAEVFGGIVKGQLVANNRSGFSVRANVTASKIDTQMALSDMAGLKRLSGRGEARIDVLGSGKTQAAIMRSLSGSGSVAMARGVISGIDLDRLMGGGDVSDGTTVFDSLNASFTIRDGDLFNKDLLLSLPNYRADGEGRVGLGARDIDYVFTPVALRANAGTGLRIPIRIKGPWADPSITPDVKAVLQQEINIDRDEFEAKVKDKLREKIKPKPDRHGNRDPIEELKDKLESEVKKGLLKLLRGD